MAPVVATAMAVTRNRSPRGGARRRRRGAPGGDDVVWHSHWKVQAKKAADKVGKDVVRELHKQIERGVNADGTPFRPYSEAYRKKKLARGDRSARPDLHFTGLFLRSLRAYAAKRLGSARAYVPIGVPNKLRNQGRGLVGLGFNWLGLARRGRRVIARKIRRSGKLFVTKPGPPSRR